MKLTDMVTDLPYIVKDGCDEIMGNKIFRRTGNRLSIHSPHNGGIVYSTASKINDLLKSVIVAVDMSHVRKQKSGIKNLMNQALKGLESLDKALVLEKKLAKRRNRK